MDDISTIINSFKKYPKTIIYEQKSDEYKNLAKGNDFFDQTTDSIIDIVSPLQVNYNPMKVGDKNSFYWSGNVENNIDWIFSIGNNDEDGFFLTMDLQKVDQNLFEGLRKLVVFFNNEFKENVVKKLHDNIF